MRTHLKPKILHSSQPMLLKELLVVWLSTLETALSWAVLQVWPLDLNLETPPLPRKLLTSFT